MARRNLRDHAFVRLVGDVLELDLHRHVFPQVVAVTLIDEQDRFQLFAGRDAQQMRAFLQEAVAIPLLQRRAVPG